MNVENVSVACWIVTVTDPSNIQSVNLLAAFGALERICHCALKVGNLVSVSYFKRKRRISNTAVERYLETDAEKPVP